MILSVPSPVADVKSSQKGYFLVYEDNLLMMAPKKRDYNVIGMSDDFDIISSYLL